MRILFVENHAVFARTVVEEFLADFQATMAPSLADARRLAAGPFEAVLVHFDLDDGKGVELALELRRSGFTGGSWRVSAHDQGNGRLVVGGADALCPKGAVPGDPARAGRCCSLTL